MTGPVKGVVAIVIASAGCLILQTTWLAGVSPKPEGVLAIVLAVSFLGGPLEGTACGFCAGLAEDALSGMSRGGFCITYALVGLVMGTIVKLLDSDNVIVLLAGGIIGAVLEFFMFKLFSIATGVTHGHLPMPLLISWFLIEGLLTIAFLSLFRIWFAPEIIKRDSAARRSWIVGTRS